MTIWDYDSAAIKDTDGKRIAVFDDILRRAAAYPRLVEALRFAMHHCDNVFATAHDPSDRDVAEYKQHRALLRELGEIE